MDTELLNGRFNRIGARLKVNDTAKRRWRARTGALSIDIGNDRKGEFFALHLDPHLPPELNVVDVRPNMRHLLLMANGGFDKADRQKFLCGHDERHWFVAAVPEAANASNVATALNALKPTRVRAAEARVGLKRRDGFRRKNRAFVRQGEWFFLPRPDARIDTSLTLRKEPLTRGLGNKPHIVDELVRSGGETVYVTRGGGLIITRSAYDKIARQDRKRARQFVRMRRNPGVFVRGRVRHPDHKTIVLHCWHEVVMNTENQASAMRHVAFLD